MKLTIIAPLVVCALSAIPATASPIPRASFLPPGPSSSQGAQPALPSEFSRRLVGRIGDLPVRMSFSRMGDGISASYVYETGRPALSWVLTTLYVEGTIDKAGRISATESITNEGGETKTTGKLSGTVALDSDGRLSFSGIWTKPDGSKPLTFKLAESNPPVLGATARQATYKEPERRLASLVKLQYPVFEGVADPKVAKLNTAISSLIESEATEFRTYFNEEPVSDEDLEHYAFEIDYEITYASNSVVSIAFFKYVSFGGAHPSSDTISFNYRLTDGTLMKIGDLFVSGTNHRGVLTTKLAAANKSIDPNPINPEDPQAFDRYFLTPQGVRFVVTVPHVMGDTAELYLPFAEISTILDPALGIR